MPYVLFQISVEDYDKWKAAFDEYGPVRKGAGSKGGLVLRNADDPTHVTILLEWDSLDNGRNFTASAGLRETMKQAGVIGPPNLYFLNEVDKPSV